MSEMLGQGGLIVEKLTIERAVELHRKLWNYIADKIKQEQRAVTKAEALVALGFDPSDVLSECFCCEYAVQHQLFGKALACILCPLKWPFGQCITRTREGLYGQWQNAIAEQDWDRAAWFARYIAEVPAKYEED